MTYLSCLRCSKVWDTRTGRQLHVLSGHTDEVLDVTFDPSGRRLASASADGTSFVWDVISSGATKSFRTVAHLTGHEGEVSKVSSRLAGVSVFDYFLLLFFRRPFISRGGTPRNIVQKIHN